MVKAYEALYTVREAAKVMKTNPTFVYGEITSGRLPCLILGSKKIRGKDLEQYINQHPTWNPSVEADMEAETI